MTRQPVSRSRRSGPLVVASLAALVAAGATAAAATAAPPSAPAQTACAVVYQLSWDNGQGGFGADITITNLGAGIDGWTLAFTFPGNQQVDHGWIAVWSQSGADVTATNEPWSAVIPAGGSLTLGFNGSYQGSNPVPDTFLLNGEECTGEPGDPTPTPSSTPSPTPTPTSTPSPTPTDPPDPGENPYAGAQVYVNPDWSEQVLAQAAETPGELGQQLAQVATYPTAVWLDRRGAITEGRGLTGHLDAALAQQQASGVPVVIQLVIYNLPNRDCASLASNGELRISEGGFDIYREEYIDVIAEILGRPGYADLRIAAIIEVDSLPNLVTNLNIPDCQEANGPGGYRDGIRYALNTVGGIPNVHSYLDLAHSGWLGWDSNFGPAVDLYVDMLTSSAHFGPAPGLASIRGFITNSANYTSTVEPFLPDSGLVLPGGGNPIRSASFYEWNPYFDEVSYAQALHSAFAARGVSDFGMLVDTSRNGWGGPDRPTEVSSSPVVDTYVNESRVDRRPHRGGWCNQAGAGIGERPVASPALTIDAYVWVKPPGESDGVADPDAPPDPTDPAKQHDPMCDPEARNIYDPQHPTNALPGAPHAGRWFPAQLAMLVTNAWPPIG